MIKILRSQEAATVLQRPGTNTAEVDRVVGEMIERIRRQGDAALLQYARDLDAFDRQSPVVSQSELKEHAGLLSRDLVSAISRSTENIQAVAELQLPRPWTREFGNGRRLSQVVRPLQSVCAYVPSGRYPLVSTIMMTTIPAKVAGVRRIIVTTPRPSPEIFGVASLLGVEEVYLLGGAQAIAAFALGTETIPRVDRIVGPGNAYVAAAKRLLAGEAAIDFVAGPTEIMIIAREGKAGWIAADMLAQAEHDSDSAAIFLTTSNDLAQTVAAELEKQLAVLPTARVAAESLKRNGAIIVVESIDQAIELANEYAPEHLSVDQYDLVDRIENAGSVFVGPYSPEAAGDYSSGPNHVLPTAGFSRVRGGLSTADFVKTISVQELSATALTDLSPAITALARVEGLEGHARSVEARGK